jgi:hypothetical protein
MFIINFSKDIESFEDKKQDIRFTKQISLTRLSNHLFLDNDHG